jgi:four helix bundle protein
MTTARGYRDLLVWQKGMVLVREVYILTKGFPDEERFGLISQMRRAVVSIPSNIAEGQARHTTREFIQFISHAEGSLAELDTQIRVSIELGFCQDAMAARAASVLQLADELRRMPNSLRRKLEGSLGSSLVTRHSSLVTCHL